MKLTALVIVAFLRLHSTAGVSKNDDARERIVWGRQCPCEDRRGLRLWWDKLFADRHRESVTRFCPEVHLLLHSVELDRRTAHVVLEDSSCDGTLGAHHDI